jgi:calcium-dependent protein kinase
MGILCVKASHPASSVEMGDPCTFNQYRFTEEILGEGAFSQVKKCFDAQGHPVAIKCVRLADLRSDLHLIKREVQILQKVRHPAIVKFLGCFEDPEHIYIVTELCEAGNLMNRISQMGTLQEKEVQNMSRSLLEALRYMHAMTICHRDLKPENILFTKDGHPKIVDFGLARVLEQARVVSIVGTPYYLAPEVTEGKYNTKCDMWSLGVLLFYALVGHLPFEGTDWEELRRNVMARNISDWGQVSQQGKMFILKLLQINPNVRVSAAEALQDVWINSRF